MRYHFTVFAAAALMAGTAVAQTMTPAAKPPLAAAAKPARASVVNKAVAQTRAAPATAKAPVVRTAKSLDCSKQADAKGLHGKPRKGFMSSCKKA